MYQFPQMLQKLMACHPTYRRRITQKELAERTGIRPPTISAICLGTIKQLPIEGLNKICKALDCQPSDLMEYVEDSTEDTPGTAE